MVSRDDFLPVVIGLVGGGAIAHHCQQFTVVACGAHGIVVGVVGLVGIVAHAVDAGGVAGVDHHLDVFLACHPVGHKHAGCAGHGEEEGVGCQRVAHDGVLRGVGTALGVVVLYEGHGIAAVVAAIVVVAHQRPTAIVLLAQVGPVVAVDGIAHGVAELEVEGGALNLAVGLRGFNPVADGVGTVPALAHGIFHAAVAVVLAGIGAAVALHHVVAETRIAEVVDEVFQIGVHVVLHVLAHVVEVAHAAPSLSGVVVGREGVAVL